jgi:hypothetical protein
MTFDRHEFTELSQRNRQEAVERRNGSNVAQLAGMLQQAAVSAADLTADPKWDVYLQYLQAGVEKMTASRDAWAAMLTDPVITGHEQLLAAKIGWATADATVKAWQVAIGLPKDIATAGEQAKDLMSRMQPEGQA